MPDFAWSKSRQRYIDKRTGRAVPANVLMAWINNATNAASARTERIAEKLNRGEITDRQFQIAMHQEITKGHHAFAAIAFGGLAVMTASRWVQAGRFIGRQLGYLTRFFGQIVRGQVSQPELVNRAGMYQEALYGTYANSTVLRERELGARYVRRVLDPAAEHCTDCPELAGVYPIESVPPIGASQCGSRCRCSIEPADGQSEAAA